MKTSLVPLKFEEPVQLTYRLRRSIGYIGRRYYQCHAILTISTIYSINFNLNPYPYHTFLQFPTISQFPTMQLLSSTLLSTSLTEYYLTLSHHNQNNTSQDNIYNISNSFYTKIIVFERHPIACFV